MADHRRGLTVWFDKRCKAKCGDYASGSGKSKDSGYCDECYAEIHLGYVPPPPGQRYQTLASHLTPRQRHGLAKTGG